MIAFVLLVSLLIGAELARTFLCVFVLLSYDVPLSISDILDDVESSP